jgi:tRNA(Ile)-lysidine synthase
MAAVAAVRSAVRPHLSRTGDELVLVACSGGADSLALAAAAAFVGPRRGWRVGLSTVDHQLQPGSAERAESLAGWAVKEGFEPVVLRPVTVEGRPGGPEAAAREARYEALVAIAREHGASRVLLGHTREDQAETVLLALLRGAGARGLAGMPVQRDVDGVALVRPLLGVSRTQTRAACAALGLQPWEDPHNGDPAFRRTHARALLGALTETLGPAVVGNLARTASLAGQDAELLDALAADAFAALDPTVGLPVAGLAVLPGALRTRVLHSWALTLGCPPAALGHVHVEALDTLVTAWHGQGAVGLPGGIEVARRAGHLVPLVL